MSDELHTITNCEICKGKGIIQLALTATSKDPTCRSCNGSGVRTCVK